MEKRENTVVPFPCLQILCVPCVRLLVVSRVELCALCVIILTVALFLPNSAEGQCANATLHYPLSTVCADTFALQPDTLQPAMGNFLIPSGLSVDTASGDIIVSGSLPGTYTLRYVAADTCHDTASFTLYILPRQSAAFTYTPATVCHDDPGPVLPTVTGNGGGTFSFSGAGLLALDSLTGAIQPTASDTGTYTVTYANSGTCPDHVNFLISVLLRPDPAILYPASQICTNGPALAPMVTGTGGGRYAAFPSGLALDTLTGAVTPQSSISGAYQVVRSFLGHACPASDTVSLMLHPAPDPSFTFPPQSCINGPNPQPNAITTQGGTFSLYPSTATINAASGLISLATAAPGSYIITHTVSQTFPPNLTCTSSELKPILISAPAPSGFSYPSDTVCATGTLPPVLTGLGGGQWYSIPSGLGLNTSTGNISLGSSQTGTYTVSYTSPGPCPSTDTFRLSVLPPSAALFSYTPASFCIGNASDPTPNILADSGGTFRAVHGPASVDAATGRIFLAQSQPSDSIVIRYVVGASGSSSGGSSSSGAETCADSMDFLIRILAPDTGITLTYDNTAYCQSAGNPFPQLSGTSGNGGSYAATPPGLSFISPFTGQVNLPASVPGTYLIRYYPPGACTDSTAGHYLTVLADDRLGFTFPPQSCTADNTARPVGLTDTLGTFLEPSGGLHFTDPQLGTVDLTQSTPGIYAIQYTSGGACKRDTTLSFALYPSPSPEILSSATDNTFCEGDSIQFLAFGGDRYEWRVNGAVVQPLQPAATYIPDFPLQNGDLVLLTAQNINGGCTMQDTARIKVVGTPRLTLLDHPHTVSGAEPVAVVMLAGQDSTTVWWRLQDGSGNTDQGVSKLLRQGEAFILTDTSAYSLSAPAFIRLAIVPKVGGCAADTNQIQLTRLPDDSPYLIPSLVTPNGDGMNDTWQFAVRDGLNPDDYRIVLLARQGGKVWEAETLRTEWNPSGHSDGVYWWVVERKATGAAVARGGLTIRSR